MSKIKDSMYKPKEKNVQKLIEYLNKHDKLNIAVYHDKKEE